MQLTLKLFNYFLNEFKSPPVWWAFFMTYSLSSSNSIHLFSLSSKDYLMPPIPLPSHALNHNLH